MGSRTGSAARPPLDSRKVRPVGTRAAATLRGLQQAPAEAPERYGGARRQGEAAAAAGSAAAFEGGAMGVLGLPPFSAGAVWGAYPEGLMAPPVLPALLPLPPGGLQQFPPFGQQLAVGASQQPAASQALPTSAAPPALARRATAPNARSQNGTPEAPPSSFAPAPPPLPASAPPASAAGAGPVMARVPGEAAPSTPRGRGIPRLSGPDAVELTPITRKLHELTQRAQQQGRQAADAAARQQAFSGRLFVDPALLGDVGRDQEDTFEGIPLSPGYGGGPLGVGGLLGSPLHAAGSEGLGVDSGGAGTAAGGVVEKVAAGAAGSSLLQRGTTFVSPMMGVGTGTGGEGVGSDRAGGAQRGAGAVPGDTMAPLMALLRGGSIPRAIAATTSAADALDLTLVSSPLGRVADGAGDGAGGGVGGGGAGDNVQMVGYDGLMGLGAAASPGLLRSDSVLSAGGLSGMVGPGGAGGSPRSQRGSVGDLLAMLSGAGRMPGGGEDGGRARMGLPKGAPARASS